MVKMLDNICQSFQFVIIFASVKQRARNELKQNTLNVRIIGMKMSFCKKLVFFYQNLTEIA